MSATAIARDDLSARAARWMAAMRSADTGPLVIADEVVSVVDEWSKYQAEVGCVTADAWLTKTFRVGLGVTFWRRRADANRILGEGIRRALHHEAAVWIVRSVPADVRGRVVFEAFKLKKRQDAPVAKNQARRLYREIGGVKSAPKTCGECERLRALLVANGIETE